jgi:hypothetical protein
MLCSHIFTLYDSQSYFVTIILITRRDETRRVSELEQYVVEPETELQRERGCFNVVGELYLQSVLCSRATFTSASLLCYSGHLLVYFLLSFGFCS